MSSPGGPQPVSTGWDGVIETYRASFDRFARMRSTLTVMLRLVDTLRADPRFAGVEQHTSHLALMMWRPPYRDRMVGVMWSEPDGIGWAGSEGFVVYKRSGMLEVSDRVVVSEPDVAATLVAYLGQ